MKLYMFNVEERKILNDIINNLYSLNYFNEKRYNWLIEITNNRQMWCLTIENLHANILRIIYQKKEEYENIYLVEVGEFVSKYSKEDTDFFKDNINKMDKIKNFCLSYTLHEMPYEENYFSTIENRIMTNHREQGMDRIYMYDRYNKVWWFELA